MASEAESPYLSLAEWAARTKRSPRAALGWMFAAWLRDRKYRLLPADATGYALRQLRIQARNKQQYRERRAWAQHHLVLEP
jgi:hypothetical protein